MKTATVEQYLQAIYRLTEPEGSVRPSELARYLGISAASVSEMLKRLCEQGLVKKDDSSRVSLTAEGEEYALKIVRRHRLAERLLTDILGLSWDEVHEEACRLEHAISPLVEERLDMLLEFPDSCPHGYPIPGRDGPVKREDSLPLAALSPGQAGIVTRVAEEDRGLLRYLASLGLIPGVRVTVHEIAPFGGPLMIGLEGTRYAIGRELAAKITVIPEENRGS